MFMLYNQAEIVKILCSNNRKKENVNNLATLPDKVRKVSGLTI